jgi:alkanesulfonate monooxygenase SsuD/methylene tetrahydromethanopterin reductase-like flavin-dependent oxidoreductase (luciferase family)
VILGLGAGALDEEFRAFGLGVRSPRDKVDGLAEAIDVIRGLWSRSGFTYAGRLYTAEEAELSPKPNRQIPIWLGTFGDRALAVTGRLADGWIPSFGHAPPERVRALRERVIAAAHRAGRDPKRLTYAYHMEIRVDPRGHERPTVLAGPADELVERLLGFVEMGFTAFNFSVVGADRREQVDRLATEVLPAVRAAT